MMNERGGGGRELITEEIIMHAQQGKININLFFIFGPQCERSITIEALANSPGLCLFHWKPFQLNVLYALNDPEAHLRLTRFLACINLIVVCIFTHIPTLCT